MAPNNEAVIEAYTHALLARCPRVRYAVGKGMWRMLAVRNAPGMAVRCNSWQIPKPARATGNYAISN